MEGFDITGGADTGEYSESPKWDYYGRCCSKRCFDHPKLYGGYLGRFQHSRATDYKLDKCFGPDYLGCCFKYIDH